jgi:uncharacterized membrane protein YeiH
MKELSTVYNFLDFAGTFVFAISGAVAAKQKGMDLFGITAIAFTVACGGGIVRDVCIGVIPPSGLTNWRYLALAIIASIMTVGMYSVVQRLNRPVIFFDALGLSLFAVTGASKTLVYFHNSEIAIILGMTTAIGGGVLRDILLNRIPIILDREIYALAALAGALMVVVGKYFQWSDNWVQLIAIVICFGLRMLALTFHWNLPVYNREKTPH